MIKTYNAFVGDCDCCQQVNRNRHNVETRLSITDGQITSASCSWCGKDVEVPREKLFEGTRLIIGIFGADYDVKEIKTDYFIPGLCSFYRYYRL